MDASGALRFGGFVLNRARGSLQDGRGADLFLRPKSYRVLEALCKRRGQLMSKDALIQEAWPDVFVTDDSLAQCVSEIRRALGSDGAGLVRTVPRRGYMLVADEPANREPVFKKWGPNLWLARAGGLAAAIVMAAVTFWWAQPRDKPTSESAVAASPAEQADALLFARDWRRREDNEQARRLLETVVADAPSDAEAWARLGLTYWLEVQHLSWGGGRREMTRALALVEKSILLGGSAQSHRLLAEMRLLAPFPDMRSPIDALASARAAVAIESGDPDNLVVLAHALALTGHAGDAVRTIERARRLGPYSPAWHRQIAGLSYLLAGKPARAIEEFGPLYGAGTFASARWWPGWLFAASLAQVGRVEEAAMVVHGAQGRRPERSVAAVAHSFVGLSEGPGLDILLDGLRLAGMPD
ncbi:hypothetical protein FQ320_24275 [Oceaniovalibus sp. ACAM 378]|nr:hypothetical protein FQ320_24275 [Oceaniovalibus sp. ACAM 378]